MLSFPKPLLTLAAALLLSGAAHAQSVTELDAKYGFRDLKFETDTSAVENLTITEATPLRLSATRATDAMKIGGATISRIEYVFFQGRLMEVDIITKGLVNSKALREALEGQYGQGTVIAQVGQDRNWTGKQVLLTYREDPAFHNATVRFIQKKMYEKFQAAQKTVKKASSDL